MVFVQLLNLLKLLSNLASGWLSISFFGWKLINDRIPDFMGLSVVLALDALWDGPRKPEIAEHNLAARINENVLRFNVTVHDVSRVQVLEAAEQVVENGSEVLRLQVLVLNHLAQVLVRQLHHQKDVLKLFRLHFFLRRKSVKQSSEEVRSATLLF